jgi:hypothetical protein
MQRRNFRKATGTIITASTLPATAAFAMEQETKSRTVLHMNRNWRYHPSKVQGAHLASFKPVWKRAMKLLFMLEPFPIMCYRIHPALRDSE